MSLSSDRAVASGGRGGRASSSSSPAPDSLSVSISGFPAFVLTRGTCIKYTLDGRLQVGRDDGVGGHRATPTPTPPSPPSSSSPVKEEEEEEERKPTVWDDDCRLLGDHDHDHDAVDVRRLWPKLPDCSVRIKRDRLVEKLAVGGGDEPDELDEPDKSDDDNEPDDDDDDDDNDDDDDDDEEEEEGKQSSCRKTCVCPLCDKVYADRGPLRDHLRSVHQGMGPGRWRPGKKRNAYGAGPEIRGEADLSELAIDPGKNKYHRCRTCFCRMYNGREHIKAHQMKDHGSNLMKYLRRHYPAVVDKIMSANGSS